MASTQPSIANLADQSSKATLGLFSNTLFHSSSVNTILHAHFRAKRKSEAKHKLDVIFVHRHHVTFKEFMVEEHEIEDQDAFDEGGVRVSRKMVTYKLNQFFEKSDFDSVITGAKILQITNPNGSTSATSSPSPMRDTVAEAGRQNGNHDVCDSIDLPPHVLVLTLRRDKLDTVVLLSASEHATGDNIRIDTYQRRLPGPDELDDLVRAEPRTALRLGGHLAVEPFGRAIAVGARESRFMLYKLRPRQQWHEHSLAAPAGSNEQFQPFEEERLVAVDDGVIVRMDFLRPDKSLVDKIVILLAVIKLEDTTKLYRWDWDTTQTLSNGLTQVWTSGFPVDRRLSDPHLLIPSFIDSGFWLLSEKSLARYSGVMTDQPVASVRALHQKTENSNDLAYGSLSKERKKWTVYARPFRPGWDERYATISDLLYVGREDGKLQYLELGVSANIDIRSELIMETPPIWMDKASDTAFAVLPHYSGSEELVVTANGLFAIEPRGDFKLLQSFVDWSPVQDFCLRNATVACLNATSSDQVMSLSSAYMATNSSESNLSEEHGTRFWILDCGSSITVVSSFEDRTYLERLDLHGVGVGLVDRKAGMVTTIAEVEEVFEREARTIAAGQTNDGLIVQVTPFEIRVSAGKGTLQKTALSERTIAGAVDSDSAALILLRHAASGAHLSIWYPASDDERFSNGTSIYGARHGLDLADVHNVTCVAIQSRGDAVTCAVSTWERGVLLIRASRASGSISVQPLEAALCDSITLDWCERLVITLGTRDGHVQMVEVGQDNQEIKRAICKLGQQPVQVFAVPGGFVALCDGKLHKLETGLQRNRIFKQPVVVPRLQGPTPTDRTDDEHTLAAIMSLPLRLGHQFALVTTAKVLIAIASIGPIQTVCDKGSIFREKRQEIVPEEQYSIRQMTGIMPLEDTFAISYKHIVLTRGMGRSSNGLKTRRTTYTMLGFYDPDSKAELNEEQSHQVHKQSGTKFRRQFEWHAQINNRNFKLFVVHTEALPKSLKRNSPQPNVSDRPLGRVLLYRITNNQSGIELIEKAKLKRQCPIDYIAKYSSDSLILAYERKVEVITLRLKPGEDEKFHWDTREVRIDRPTGATGIIKSLSVTQTASGNKLIHATTSNKLFVVDEQNNVQWESDYYENMGQIHHRYVENVPVVLVLSNDGILGFTYNQVVSDETRDRFQRNALWTLFEAKTQTPVSSALQHDNSWFVGNSSEGSFRQFKVVLDHEWQLLRYIQNLSEQNKTICPFSYEDQLVHVEEEDTRRVNTYLKTPLDPARAWPKMRKAGMHINGDVLRRVTAEILRDELIPNARVHRAEWHLRTAEERLALLQDLARKAEPDLVQDQLCERVIEWMRAFWEPRL